MAITLVTDAGDNGNTEAPPGPGVNISASAGQAVIVTGLVFSTSASNFVTGITDNAGGNTWLVSTSTAQKPPAQQLHAVNSGGFAVVFVGWCLSLANAITSITIANGSGLSDFWRVSVSSWTGIVAADSGASNLYASTAAPSSTVNLFNSGDLVVGVSNTDTASFTGSPAGGSGWTDFSGAGTKPNIGYIYPQAAGNYTAQWSLSATDAAATAVQAFSPVPIGPPPSPPPAVLYSMRSFP